MQLLLLFTWILESLTQSTSIQVKIGCLKYSGSNCIQLCNLGQFECLTFVPLCEFGFFNYQDTCVQCPKQDFNDNYIIYCGDCLENSQKWQNSRICSFDYIIEDSDYNKGSYIKRVNDYNELYLIREALTQLIWSGTIPRITQRQYEVQICSGCGTICTPGFNQTCSSITNTIDIAVKGIRCLIGYYFDNGVCVACGINCLVCENRFKCSVCASKYYLNNNNCVGCPDDCIECKNGDCFLCKSPKILSLMMDSCESCGESCLRCEYVCYDANCNQQYLTRTRMKATINDIIKYYKRCRQCDGAYTINYNGKDCSQCQIRNCLTCYYTITATDNSVRSTLDIDFQPLSGGEHGSPQFCYVCESGYSLSLDQSKCMFSLPTPVVNNCNTYGSSCVQCLANYVLDLDSNSCLSFPCKLFIKNCQYCYQYSNPIIIQTIDNSGTLSNSQSEILFQCTKCNEGYYPDFFTGECIICPNRCTTCWQYSPTYNFTLFNQIPKPTGDRYVYFNDKPIQVLCTECDFGFTLYGDQCLGCTSNCVRPYLSSQTKSCIFKSKYALCSQCFEPFYQRSLKDDMTECQECPNQCLACHARNISTSPNPYFNPTSSLLEKYSRICYKTQPLTLDGKYVHFDTNLNMPIICTTQYPCKHSTSLDITIFCNSADYAAAITLNPLLKNYYYDLNLFYINANEEIATIQFTALETVALYTQMNQQPLQQLQMNIYIKGDSFSNACVLKKSTTILTSFHKNVFSLTDFTLTISSSSSLALSLDVNGDFTLQDYPKIVLSNIIFYSVSSDSRFYINSLDTLQMNHVVFRKMLSSLFDVLITNVTTVSITNSEFNNFIGNDIISIVSAKYITLNSVLFNSLKLTGQSFITLYPKTYVLMTGISIVLCTFKDYAFIADPETNSQGVGNTQISNLLIQYSTFNNSYFFQSSNSEFLKLTQFQLLDNIIYLSEIVVSNNFNVQDVIAYNCSFSDGSYLFHSSNEISDTQLSSLELSSFVGVNITYNKCENTLIYIQTPFNTEYKLMNIKIESLFVNQITTIPFGAALIKITQVGSVSITKLVIRNLLKVTGLEIETFQYAMVTEFQCDSADVNTQLPVAESCFADKMANKYCLRFEEFDRGVYISNGVIKKQLGIDSSMIYIKSYDYLTKNTESATSQDSSKFFYGYPNELIKLENIRFYNNTLGVYNPQIMMSLILIDSEQFQNIIMTDISFIGNHLHQSPSSVNIVMATCLLINSPLATVSISNSIWDDNRATRSSQGIVRLVIDRIVMNNLRFTSTNVVQAYYADILEEHQLFSDNANLEQENIQNYFQISSIGSNVYLDCDNINITNTIISDSYGLDGAGIFIVGSENLDIYMENIKMQNILCSLQQDTHGCGIFVDTSLSTLQLIILTLNMQLIIGFEGAGIYILSESQSISIQIEDAIFQGCQALDSQVFYFKQQTITATIPTILFANCTIFNNHYDSYLMNIVNKRPQLDVEGKISGSNSLIHINYGSVTLVNIIVYDVVLTQIFQFESILLLNILNAKIYNIIIGISSLITLTFSDEIGHANITGLLIKNVTEYQAWSPSQLDALHFYINTAQSIAAQSTEQACTVRADNIVIIGYIESFDIININIAVIDRNPKVFSAHQTTNYSYYTQFQNTSLIKYIYSEHIAQSEIVIVPSLFYLLLLDYLSEDPQNPSHTILFSKLTIQNVSCLNCLSGLINLQNIHTEGNQSVILSEAECSYNTIGYYGCINLLGVNSKQPPPPNITIYTIKVANSKFISNKAVMGAAIRINNASSYISSTDFINNMASNTGGALLFQQSDNALYIENLLVQGNQANIASAFFMNGLSLPYGTYFQGNIGRSVNEEIPQHLSIMIIDGLILRTQEISNNIEIVQTSLNLPSGQQISSYKLYYQTTEEQVPYEWKFRIVNLDQNYGRILTGSSSDSCEISGRMTDHNIANNTGQFLTNYTSPQSVTYKDEDYNLDDLIITFDPYLPNNYYLQLKFTCSSIKIPFGNYPYSNYSQNYSLYLDIQTLPCQLGEAYYLQKCQACIKDTYALTINQVACSNIAVDSMEEVTPVKIKLYGGYWRYDNDQVESCYNLQSNCNGGWIPGDASCYSGHIGALCESCDIYGVRGDQYSISTKYKCGLCSETATSNQITVAAICVFTLLQMIFSVKGNYQMLENFIREQVLQSMGVRINNNQANLSILIKLMTNYFQIISALGSFRISIPTNLISSVDVVANPTQSMAYSLDCFLIEFSFVDILYFRMIWALIMPIIYLFVFFFGYATGILLNLLPSKIGIIYTTLIYMFIYLQPTLIAGFIALLSARTLGGVDFVQSDVQFLYSTHDHYFWMLIFAGPNLLVWGAFFPYIFMHLIRKSYNTLYTIPTRRKYGYFYNEYTQHAYLWEFVKIFEKQFVLMVLTYYEDTIIIKGLIVFLIVFVYGILSFEFSPYQSKRLNYIDQMSSAVCIVSLCLGVLIKASQSENIYYLQVIMFLIIGILNAFFMMILIYEVFRGYLDKFEVHIDKLRDFLNGKIPKLKRIPWLRKFLINRGELKKRVKYLWAILRYETHKGIMRKKSDKTQPLFQPKLISQESEKDHSRIESKANSRLSVIDINQEELMNLANNSSVQIKTPEIQKIYPQEKFQGVNSLTKLKKAKKF